MHSVGEYQVREVQRLIVQKGCDKVVFDLGAAWGKLNVVFEAPTSVDSTGSVPPKGLASVRFTGEGSAGTIHLVNWNSPLGTALLEPMIVGTTNDGDDLFVLLAVASHGGTRLIDLQLMTRAKESP